MKILQAIDAGGWGGAENVVAQLSNGLAERGHEVEVWVRKGSVLCGELQEGVRVRNIPFLNDYDPFTIMMFKRALKNYDVMHVHLGRASILSGYATFFCRQNVHRLFCHMHSFHKPKHYRNQRQIICVSRSVEEYVKKTMPWVEKAWVVYNGIDTSRAKTAKPLLEREGNKIRIGLLATFKEKKGHADLLRAISKLGDDLPVELILGGDGPLLAEMKDLSLSLEVANNVRFIGVVPPYQAFSFWKSVDIGCFPSSVEGFGISILEALTSGLPVVVYDYNGVYEVVGNAGVVVPKGNVEVLAHALKTLIKDKTKRERLALKSLERSRIFSRSAMVEKMLQIYEERMG